jgi:hypothetical protein
MEVTRLTFTPKSGYELTFIVLGDWYIQENLLHPVESEALFKAFADAADTSELETLLETRYVGVKTIMELLNPLLLTENKMEEKVLNFPMNRKSKINVFSFAVGTDTIIQLNPDFSNYEITCVMLEGSTPFVTGTGGKVIVYGKSFISEYFTQIQNGIFFSETPDTICMVSVALKELKVVDMDLPAEVTSYKIRVRSYNE